MDKREIVDRLKDHGYITSTDPSEGIADRADIDGDEVTKEEIIDALGYVPADENDIPDVSDFITNETDDLVNYYKKSETYTKAQTDAAIEAEVETVTKSTYESAWDGASVPVPANIPAGVSVTYNATTYTGTLAASESTLNKIYLVSTGTTDEYNRYITSRSGEQGSYTYSWVSIGTTTIELSDYATKTELNQLGQEVIPVLDEFDELTPFAIFDGSTCLGTCDAIELSTDGDSIEMDLYPNVMTGNQIYALASHGYNTVSIGATRLELAVRSSDNTWIVSPSSLGSEKSHYVLKIVYEDSKIKTYIDDTLFNTYNGQKTIQITRWGKYSDTAFWYGKVGYVKINSTSYQLNQLSGWQSSTIKFKTDNAFLTEEQAIHLEGSQLKANLVETIGSTSDNTHYPGAKAVYDFGKDANYAADKIAKFLPDFDALPLTAFFDGSTSVGLCDTIELSSDGDSIEIDIYPGEMSSNQIYGLATHGYQTVSLGATRTEIAVRALDSTWIVSPTSIGATKTHYVLKIVYEDSKIKTYIDNVLFNTYNGQKTIQITRWGKYSDTAFWNGKVGYIKISSTVYDNLTQLPGWESSTVIFKANYGFLTNKQANSLLGGEMYVSHTIGASESFWIRCRYGETNIYFMLELRHVIDNSDAVYSNQWRLAGSGKVQKRISDEEFIDLGKTLLVGSENEFTFRYSGTADFTGGYHGDERIDTNGCFANFYINGIQLSSTDLQSEWKKECASFYMLQKSTLHETTPEGGSPVPGHPVIAYHYKKLTFGNSGYQCVNRVDFDLSNSNLESIQTTDLFTGLVCVSKDCALTAYADDFVLRDISNGDNTGINITDAVLGKVEFYSDSDLSCVVDSNTATENNKNLTILLWDRENDSKYYRYAQNRVFETGDTYMSDVSVSWRYKIES